MSMADDIGVMEAIYSQRQITRYRRDPVSREDIEKIIDAAIRAPSGGNTQPWHFIAITERDLIEKIGGLYRDIWLGAQGAEPGPNEPPAYQQARHLANRMPEVPAMILVCVDHSKGSAPYTPGQPVERGRYASSVWLAIQNLFLAAPGPWAGHADYDSTHSGRGADQGLAGHPGTRGDGVPDAAGVSSGQLRANSADTCRGSQLLQPVWEPLAVLTIRGAQPLVPLVALQ
ncbi:Putative NADH dehydrogenase/NAD(P)H nitroreductase AF_2267 [Geodia barretti]|uniref:NADH dehydrogenase/NAD(P)H nitroreductase AF_2267 n=1 Tax=Geodia barretti TaxID=519541 RepID=A0AA35T5T7_GEOBA|nr:Putative NADH dehydrogenase/NAD(P)H nitroreductase AF_2267 [Geodia barretti]